MPPQLDAHRLTLLTQREEARLTLDTQREAHEATLTAEAEAHAKAITTLTDQLNLERSAKENSLSSHATAEALWEKEKQRLVRALPSSSSDSLSACFHLSRYPAPSHSPLPPLSPTLPISTLAQTDQVESYRTYSSTANRALHDNTKALRDERDKERNNLEERHKAHRDELRSKIRSLEEEVERLRDVQSEVLERGGALPGGEARAYLFYESTKTRKLLEQGKESTISWRGVAEQPPSPPSPAPPSDREARRKAKAGGVLARPQSARPMTQASRPQSNSPPRPKPPPRAPPYGVGY